MNSIKRLWNAINRDISRESKPALYWAAFLIVAGGSLLLAASIGASYWNVRKSWKISKYVYGELLLYPKEWRSFALYAAGCAALWALSWKIGGRRLGPLALAPAAVGGAFAATVLVDPWTREIYTYMIWSLGFGLTLAMAAWTCALPSLGARITPRKLRLFAKKYSFWLGSAVLAILQSWIVLWCYRYMDLKLHDMYVEAYDFSNLHQSMWTLGHLGVSKTTVMHYTDLPEFGYRWWAEHFTPIQFFLLPFYSLNESLRGLLVLQYAALFFTPFVLLFAAREETKSPLMAFCLALAYMVHPFTVQAAINDFHFEMFFPLFFFGAYYFYAKRRLAGFAILLLAAFSVKETVALYVFFWGLSLALFAKGRRRWGVLIAALSISYFLFAAQYAIPLHRGGAMSRVAAERYNWIFEGRGLEPFASMGEVVKASLRYPQDILSALFTWERRRSLPLLLAPLACLCLLRPWTLLIFLPAALVNILSSYPLQAGLRIYHPLEFMPLAMVATALAIREPSILRIRGRRRRLNACLALALIISLWGGHASRSLLPTGGLYPKHPPFLHRPDERARQIHDLLLAVGPEPVVATSYMLCVPLSGREWLFHTELPPEADLFIAARGYLGAPVETYAEAEGIMLSLVREALESGEWRFVRPYEPGPEGLGLLWLERAEDAEPLPSQEIDAILTDLQRVEPK